MKSGGPWNLRGLRPQAHEAGRDVAHQPGISLGEWLNSIVRSSEHEESAEAHRRHDALPEKSRYRRDRVHGRATRVRYEGRPYRDEPFANHDDSRRDADERAHTPRQPRRDYEDYPLRDSGRADVREDAGDNVRQQDARLQAEFGKKNLTDTSAEPRPEAAYEGPPRAQEHQQGTREKERRELAPETAHGKNPRESAADEDRRLEARHESAHTEAARAREGLGDINARLDQLTQQLDRLAHAQSARQRSVLARLNEPADPGKSQSMGGRPERSRTKPEPAFSIEDAVAQITARQRVLDAERAAPAPSTISEPALEPETAPPRPAAEPSGAAAGTGTGTMSHPALTPQAEALNPGAVHSAALDAVIVPPSPCTAPSPALDLRNLEAQLRQITTRMEALQPAGDIEKAIAAVRADLADISRQLSEALPRRAVESLEIEVKALGERIEHTRRCGVDSNVLAGLERGLAEVRDALRALTPAENLVGFDETVKALSQRLDTIPARDDPSALPQLEAAIGGLRGVVSHVASNDTLTRLADDVRTLSSQVDRLASNAVPGPALAALEQRIDTLAAALTTSSEAGRTVPRDLEPLLIGIIEKLERVQLAPTDHAPLAQLDDRIAGLVQRFDASDARLGHLETIERGLADLIERIEGMRGAKRAADGAMPDAPAFDAIERHVAEIKQNGHRTHGALEAVQGTVERLVDRLASVENNLRHERGRPGDFVTQSQAAPEPIAAPVPRDPPSADVADAPSLMASAAALTEEAGTRSAGARLPIDPTLPPDHPLEPGSTARARPPSAAERIADSQAAIGSVKPPVISDSERPNFIAAARRAAQAAASEPPKHRLRIGAGTEQGAALPNKLSRHMRKLIVVGSIVLIVVGCIRIATKFFDKNHGGGVPPSMQSGQTAPPDKSAQKGAPARKLPSAAPALPHPPAPAPPNTSPTVKPTPGRQSMRDAPDETADAITAAPPSHNSVGAIAALPSWAVPDITGALSVPQAAPGVTPTHEKADVLADHKLPVTIGNPALRKAVTAGDPAAAYEVASRFAEGRGVLQNNEEAAYWLQKAAKQGLAPAQFRLGSAYEKGLGVKKDLATARDLYLAAARQGNGNAMHNLAVLYAEGINGPPDYRKAATWFRKAADHGIRDSQYNLGILYARGIGVQKSNAESYKWFALAAKQGDKDAASKRDEIASRLDRQSLAAARLAVQNWSPEPQPDDAITVKTALAWDSAAKVAQSTKPQ